MSRVQMLRALVNERLTAAVDDIFGFFETTIAEYQEEVSSSKEEINRQRKLLDAILNPEIRLKRAEPQQLFVCKEEIPPEQQERRPGLDQEEPGLPHIKEEQEQFIQGLEEAEVLALTLLTEKSENEDKQSSQLNPTQTGENREAEPLASTSTEQMKTEADGEDCGVSEPVSNLDSARDLEPISDGQLLSLDCCEAKTEDSGDDWRSMEPSNELKLSSPIPSMVGCKMYGKSFPCKTSLMSHVIIHSRECGLCGKLFDSGESLKLHFQAHRACNSSSKNCSINKLEQHMQVHTSQKLFSSTVCEKGFGQKNHLDKHMRSHTREKLFGCSLCSKRFFQRGHLHVHMRVHTGEKPFCCSICSKEFDRKESLKTHMRIHTGEKPFSCSICSKTFSQKGNLKLHMRIHTGEKPFSCSVCGKNFGKKEDLKRHMRVHTGEKPYSCSVCGKSCNHRGNLNKHMRIHTGDQGLTVAQSVVKDFVKEGI